MNIFGACYFVSLRPAYETTALMNSPPSVHLLQFSIATVQAEKCSEGTEQAVIKEPDR